MGRAVKNKALQRDEGITAALRALACSAGSGAPCAARLRWWSRRGLRPGTGPPAALRGTSAGGHGTGPAAGPFFSCGGARRAAFKWGPAANMVAARRLKAPFSQLAPRGGRQLLAAAAPPRLKFFFSGRFDEFCATRKRLVVRRRAGGLSPRSAALLGLSVLAVASFSAPLLVASVLGGSAPLPARARPCTPAPAKGGPLAGLAPGGREEPRPGSRRAFEALPGMGAADRGDNTRRTFFPRPTPRIPPHKGGGARRTRAARIVYKGKKEHHPART